MKKETVHTERVNFLVSPQLKKNIEIAAHAQLGSVSDYIRGLIYNDLINNSVVVDQTEDNGEILILDYVARHRMV